MHLNSDLLFFFYSMTTHAVQGRAGLPPPLESSTEVDLETSYIHFGTKISNQYGGLLQLISSVSMHNRTSLRF